MNKQQEPNNRNSFFSLDDYPDVLTVYDLASILRVNVSTAYQMLHEGYIPYRKIGTIFRISKKSLLEFLETTN